MKALPVVCLVAILLAPAEASAKFKFPKFHRSPGSDSDDVCKKVNVSEDVRVPNRGKCMAFRAPSTSNGSDGPASQRATPKPLPKNEVKTKPKPAG